MYLYQSCQLRYEISSCANDYEDSLSTRADCTIDCNDDDGPCIACGGCQQLMIAVGPGQVHTDSWAGHHYTFGTSSQGCSCHNEFETPAGKYHIEVPVYDSDDPYTAQVIGFASADFTLPAPEGTVPVMIGNLPD